MKEIKGAEDSELLLLQSKPIHPQKVKCVIGFILKPINE